VRYNRFSLTWFNRQTPAWLGGIHPQKPGFLATNRVGFDHFFDGWGRLSALEQVRFFSNFFGGFLIFGFSGFPIFLHPNMYILSYNIELFTAVI
jgi:hypothetical protein